MAKILCADTSSQLCSVSIFNNDNLIDNISSKIERSHSKLLLILIDSILNKNNLSVKDLDAFSIAKGPGSYTGLRIGVSTFKGLCYSLEKPLIGINTLEILSMSAKEKILDNEYNLCPMIDARRMEVFTKLLNQDLEEVGEDKALILEENSFNKFRNKKIYFFGDGSYKFQKITNYKNHNFLKNIESNSQFMGDLSYKKYLDKDFEDISLFEPFYIKDFHLVKKKKKWIRL
tara:strand:- start:704 stop:1396 length:693 start_codon:yes stop_codon:yes gene_type:complete